MALRPLSALLAGVAALALSSGALAASSAFEAEIAASKGAMVAQPQAALDHAQKAQSLAANAAAPADTRALQQATAQWLSAEALVRLKRPDQALSMLDQALAVVTKVQPTSKLRGDVLKSHGRAAEAVGQVQVALKDFQDAYAIYQKVNEPRAEALSLQEIGSIYSDARDYPNVLRYYAQSSEIFGEDPVLNMVADNNRGFALKDLGRLAEAEAAFRKALASAVQMKSVYLQAQIISNIAYTEALEGKAGPARSDVNRGLALAAKDPEARLERPYLLGVLAKIDVDANNYEAAGGLLDQVFSGVDLGSSPMAFRDFHELAAKVYDHNGDPQRALRHLKAFKRLDDEGRTLAGSTNAALMAAKFDFANQTTRIAQLKAGELKRDVLLAQSKARFTATVTTILLVAGAIGTSLILHAFFTMRRSRNRIRVVNAELETSNTALEKALLAKTEFLATTSHEIRTPLNGILGMTDVMLADAQVKGDIRERLGVVKSAGETMSALVNDLLDVAKIETGHLSVRRDAFDLTRLLADTARMWADRARTKGLGFEADLEHCPTWIVDDADRLRQILFNLLSNAAKFTESGSIRLTAGTKAGHDGERLVIAVQDTGIGIPADQLDRIFESFTQVDGKTTRRFGGTGLGLTICRNLAEALDGSVRVDSTLGQGSTFTIDLPLVRAEAQVSDAAAAEVRPRSLLVIEDNPLAQSLIRAVLQPVFSQVEFSPDVDAAAEILAHQHFDRIIADGACLARREPQDPAAALGRLARQNAAPITVLWPSLTDEQSIRLAALGVDQILAKPITPAALLAALQDRCAASVEPGNQSPAFGLSHQRVGRQ